MLESFTSTRYLGRNRIVLRILTVCSNSLISRNALSLCDSVQLRVELFLISLYIGRRGPRKRKFPSRVGKRFSLSKALRQN